ncbi:hypothetical protein JANAI62_32300 [Jannaschia pagri]|uniref:Uncharacterized protein n=1 Tax=Jannaschia pagri TaxID=2829797 RepID=A0ABQ4NQA8_9RHOB|nr:hypothetical protein JANAI61_32300 [Jannaschia sp. AI_61]GIT96607.1 hypothetical protein JANAI62_32300 [Jannaschia sp. AI_62]
MARAIGSSVKASRAMAGAGIQIGFSMVSSPKALWQHRLPNYGTRAPYPARFAPQRAAPSAPLKFADNLTKMPAALPSMFQKYAGGPQAGGIAPL